MPKQINANLMKHKFSGIKTEAISTRTDRECRHISVTRKQKNKKKTLKNFTGKSSSNALWCQPSPHISQLIFGENDWENNIITAELSSCFDCCQFCHENEVSVFCYVTAIDNLVVLKCIRCLLLYIYMQMHFLFVFTEFPRTINLTSHESTTNELKKEKRIIQYILKLDELRRRRPRHGVNEKLLSIWFLYYIYLVHSSFNCLCQSIDC